MSNKALTWAFDLAIKPSWVKFVLVAMADVASEQGIAFPSIAHLCAATSEDRKTVIGAIAKLEAMGVLADTGERRGRTGQVKVYLLDLTFKGAAPGTVEEVKSPAETVPPEEQLRTETVPPVPSKSTVQPPQESRRRDTKPLEPPMNHSDHSVASAPPKRGTRLPDDWRPPPDIRSFVSDLGLDPDQLRDEFVDFWTSVPGSKGLKLDWGKTFKNRARELMRRPAHMAPMKQKPAGWN